MFLFWVRYPPTLRPPFFEFYFNVLISRRIQFFGCGFRRKLSHYSHIILSPHPPPSRGGTLTCVSPLRASHGPRLSPHGVGGSGWWCPDVFHDRSCSLQVWTDTLQGDRRFLAQFCPHGMPLHTHTHFFFFKHKAFDFAQIRHNLVLINFIKEQRRDNKRVYHGLRFKSWSHRALTLNPDLRGRNLELEMTLYPNSKKQDEAVHCRQYYC